MGTAKTPAQLDPAITISLTLLECCCNYQLFGFCLSVQPFLDVLPHAASWILGF